VTYIDSWFSDKYSIFLNGYMSENEFISEIQEMNYKLKSTYKDPLNTQLDSQKKGYNKKLGVAIGVSLLLAVLGIIILAASPNSTTDPTQAETAQSSNGAGAALLVTGFFLLVVAPMCVCLCNLKRLKTVVEGANNDVYKVIHEEVKRLNSVYNKCGLQFQPNEEMKAEITGAVTNGNYTHVQKNITHRLWIEIFINPNIPPQAQRMNKEPISAPKPESQPIRSSYTPPIEQHIQPKRESYPSPQMPPQHHPYANIPSTQQLNNSMMNVQQPVIYYPPITNFVPPSEARLSVVPQYEYPPNEMPAQQQFVNTTVVEIPITNNEVPDEPAPAYLPPHWEEKVDRKGRTYYTNHLLKITQWQGPVV